MAVFEQLAEFNPSLLFRLSELVLGNCHDTTESRQVLEILASRGWLAGLVRQVAATDPGLAGGIAQLGQQFHPSLEKELDSSWRDGEIWPPPGDLQPVTWLGILGGVERMMAMIPVDPLPEGLDAQGRARLAELVGNGARLWNVLDTLLSDSDARVRANAVEAMWHIPPEVTLSRYQQALEDTHHRVRANALVGLSFAGDPRSLSGLIDMAEAGEGMVRLAAFWAMGRTGDSRFRVFLKDWRQQYRAEPDALRGTLGALVRLKNAETLTRSANAQLRVLSHRVEGGELVLEVAVSALNGAAPPAIRGGHLEPWAGGQPIWRYRAEFHPEPDPGGAWTLRFPAPESGPAPVTLRLRSPRWVADAIPANPA